jgi:hypothetical protein
MMPDGNNEVGFSDVAETEGGRGCGLGRRWYGQGDVSASSTGTSGIMKNGAGRNVIIGKT